jgi:hypothetical protein
MKFWKDCISDLDTRWWWIEKKNRADDGNWQGREGTLNSVAMLEELYHVVRLQFPTEMPIWIFFSLPSSHCFAKLPYHRTAPPSGLVPARLQHDIRFWSVSLFRCFSCHSSLWFHQRTKHIDVNFHFIRIRKRNRLLTSPTLIQMCSWPKF